MRVKLTQHESNQAPIPHPGCSCPLWLSCWKNSKATSHLQDLVRSVTTLNTTLIWNHSWYLLQVMGMLKEGENQSWLWMGMRVVMMTWSLLVMRYQDWRETMATESTTTATTTTTIITTIMAAYRHLSKGWTCFPDSTPRIGTVQIFASQCHPIMRWAFLAPQCHPIMRWALGPIWNGNGDCCWKPWRLKC